MATENTVDYEAVIADLEAKKSQIENTIAGLRAIAGMAPVVTGPSGPGGGSHPPTHRPGSDVPASGAFLGLSIPEATKKHLAAVRRKLSTQEVISALEAGGLPQSSYQTIYGVLRRRERQVGDLINMKGDWAIAEWYPNHAKKSKAKGGATAENDEEQTA